MSSLSALHKKLEQLQNRTRSIIALHEVNRIFWQTDILSSQIPESYAAGAYNTMQLALVRHEVVLLMSLWDGRKNDYGILSILKDSIEVAEEIKDYIFSQRTKSIRSTSFVGNWTNEEKKSICESWLNQDIDEAIQDAEKSVKYLRELHNFLKYKYQKDKNIQTNDMVPTACIVRNLRDKISHAAEKTDIEQKLSDLEKNLDELREITFVDVENFFKATMKIIDKISYYLKLEINSLGTQDIARERAEELLLNCTFNISKPS